VTGHLTEWPLQNWRAGATSCFDELGGESPASAFQSGRITSPSWPLEQPAELVVSLRLGGRPEEWFEFFINRREWRLIGIGPPLGAGWDRCLSQTIVCANHRLHYGGAMPHSHAASDSDLDSAFAALGDPVRRALVSRLAESDATVGELAEPFDLTPQAISHHVGVLRRCGLVEQRREGTRRRCRLRADQLSLLGTWIDDQRRAWNDRLDVLEQHLTDEGAVR
jgi:DNA-binding transcriptional ArsR family regulator